MNDIESKALALPDKARQLRIVDTATFQSAGVMLVDIKALRGELDATFDPTIKAAHNAHKTAVAAKKKVEAPLAEAETIIKSQMGEYQTEQERIRKEQQDRIDAELRRMEEEKRLNTAVALDNIGAKDAAEKVLNEPIVIRTPKVAPVPKVEGVSFRETWHAEVIDLPALVRYCATESPALLALYLQANMAPLNQAARTMKGQMNIPGVKAVCDKSVSATSKDPW